MTMSNTIKMCNYTLFEDIYISLIQETEMNSKQLSCYDDENNLDLILYNYYKVKKSYLQKLITNYTNILFDTSITKQKNLYNMLLNCKRQKRFGSNFLFYLYKNQPYSLYQLISKLLLVKKQYRLINNCINEVIIY